MNLPRIPVLVVGQTPPPYGGQAVMIHQFVEGSYSRLQLFHQRMAYSSGMNQIGHADLRKLVHLLGLILRTWKWRFKIGPCFLYYPPAGPHYVPFLRDVVFLLSTRWIFRGLIIHFHAAGVSDLISRAPRPLRFLGNLAYGHALCAIRPSSFNPDDGCALNAARSIEVPNGLDDHFRSFSPAVRCPNKRPHILFVGVVSETKGALVLIDAITTLLENGFDLDVSLVGEMENDDVRLKISRRLESRLLMERVHVSGRLVAEAKWSAYRRADIFCLPTFFPSESFSLVTIEAMQASLPVIGTKWRGLQSIVVEGETGFLVPPKDSGAIAKRLETLIVNPDLGRRMGEAGRQRYLREYSLELHRSRMEQAIVESLEHLDARRYSAKALSH